MKKFLKYTIKLVVVIGLVFVVTTGFSQPATLSYMKGIPQSRQINPAFVGQESGFYISFPGLAAFDFSTRTNGWSYNDLIHYGTGQQADSLIIDLNGFVEHLDGNNRLMQTAAFTVLDFGFRYEQSMFTFTLTEKEFAEPFFGENLVRLVRDGNAPYMGQNFNTGHFGLNGQHYREFAFGYARKMNDQLTIGVTTKLLFGKSAIRSRELQAEVWTAADGSSVDLTSSGTINISAPVDYTYDENGYVKEVDSRFDAEEYLKNSSNFGLGLDFGLDYNVTEAVRLNISIIDLGFISWKSDLNTLEQNGSFTYRGIDVTNSLDKDNPGYESTEEAFEALGDSIKDAFKMSNQQDGFTTSLPTRIYLGGTYEASESWTFGGLARVRLYDNKANLAFTASANARVGRVLDLSASYSIMDHAYNNLGLGFGLRGGPFQVYAVTDNILAVVKPSTTSTINMRLGMNFIFGDNQGRKKHYGRF